VADAKRSVVSIISCDTCHVNDAIDVLQNNLKGADYSVCEVIEKEKTI